MQQSQPTNARCSGTGQAPPFFYGKALGLIVFLLCACLFAFWVRAYFAYTVDDAFISFRYAKMLAEGNGLTYNPDGHRVEGYSSFLWVLLMTVPHLLHLNVVLFAKLVGLLCALGCCAAVFGFAWRLNSASACSFWIHPAWFCLLAMVSFPGTTVHAVAGMETALFTLLNTVFLLATYAYLTRPGKQRAVLIAVLALLLGLTRPDGNLIALVALVAIWWLARDRGARRSLLTATVLLYVLPGLIYFGWRLAYYRVPLPLPFYIKVGHPVRLPGLVPVAYYLLAGVGGVTGLFCLLGLLRIDRRILPAALGVAVLLFFYLFTAHMMGYTWRYSAPTFPAFAILASLGFSALQNSLLSERAFPERVTFAGSRPVVLLLLAGILALLVGTSSVFGLKEKSLLRSYAEGLQKAHIFLGRQLAEFRLAAVPATRTLLLATGDAGAVPYLSGWQTMDAGGLNDPEIAWRRRPVGEYVMGNHPDLVILTSSDPEVFLPNPPGNRDLLDACLNNGYGRVKVLTFKEHVSYLWLMAKPETAVGKFLANLSQPSSR